MSATMKSTEKPSSKPFKKSNSNKSFKKGSKKGAVNKNLPPLAFMILDLTSKSRDARIIKITQLKFFDNGESELSHHFFSNEDVEISAEAFAHHGITAEQLKDKPKLSSFDFNAAKNILVWDGQVTRNLLSKNGITKYAPLVNLQSLARYLEDVQSPIRLNDYALKAIPKKKNMLEFQLKKAENKIHVLPEIYKHIKGQYLEKYSEDCIPFLVTVGKARNKKLALEAIKSFLEKREQIQKIKQAKAAKGNAKHKAKQAIEPTKVEVVQTNLSQANQGVKAVVVKRKKAAQ